MHRLTVSLGAIQCVFWVHQRLYLWYLAYHRLLSATFQWCEDAEDMCQTFSWHTYKHAANKKQCQCKASKLRWISYVVSTTVTLLTLFSACGCLYRQHESTAIWLVSYQLTRNWMIWRSVPSVLRCSPTPEFCRVSTCSVSSVCWTMARTDNLETTCLVHCVGKSSLFQMGGYQGFGVAEELLHGEITFSWKRLVWTAQERRGKNVLPVTQRFNLC